MMLWRAQSFLHLLATVVLSSTPLTAQMGGEKPPEPSPVVEAPRDSLLVTVPLEGAQDRTLAAFARVGLTVVRTSPGLIEADVPVPPGTITIVRARGVQALILGSGDSATVLLTGTEWLDGGGRKAITRTTKGNGGKVWRQIEAIAAALHQGSSSDSQ